jgi:ElaB/YqjD/DUF883 family membrane-anchored ribosome-binding protein
MKNLFILTLLFGLFALTSCQKAAEKTEEAAETVAETTEEAAQKAEEASDAVTTSLAIPQFEDEAISTYLKEYSEFVGKYEMMMKDKENVAKEQLEELKTQANDFAKRAADVTSKLKKDEFEKFNTFFKKLQERWAAANK